MARRDTERAQVTEMILKRRDICFGRIPLEPVVEKCSEKAKNI